MLEPSIRLMKQKADSRYTLAIMAAKRARDIIEGKPRLIDTDIEKPISIAVSEIAQDYITYKREEK
jgi:DNA-directed RNA polymerase subunit omega